MQQLLSGRKPKPKPDSQNKSQLTLSHGVDERGDFADDDDD